ncbi:hypothetical protein ACJMK2_013304 [Sinanodonta woodiana]|uniref:Tyrosine-protein kinase receptor n=1 Tax=Sinanodonta woodiana TaxID=1069815 RepID=A0ABD3UXT3_SINWO
MPNDTNSGYCLCVKFLTVLTKDKECPPPAESTAPKAGDGTEHDGVIYLQPFFKPDTNHTNGGPLKNDLSKNSHSITNQNVTVIPEHSSRPDYTLILKIFPPIAAFLVITAIVAFIVIRKLRICSRQRTRKKGPMIKACEDLKLLDRLNVVNKNPSYFYHVSGLSGKPIEVRSIPIEQICIQDVVGEGAFGQVFKGLMYADENREHFTRIAVKVLKEGVSTEARDDFEREVEIMSAFEHDNILKLLGIVTPASGDTPYMIFEYMVHGDLAQLLRRNDPSIAMSNSDFRLSKSNLIDIATQIANGMTYLNSQHFVHRDLATRNCLVGEGLAVKISDFGMARDIYTCDYYRIGGSRMLPVRWMSPESVKWGRFTTESDIWAFGVVLWEIHSYGRQPYYGHSNEEVIRFLDEGILLQRPDECPSTVYHVMLGCWKTDPKERLPFSKIYKYLNDYSAEVARSAQLQLNGNDSETEHPT